MRFYIRRMESDHRNIKKSHSQTVTKIFKLKDQGRKLQRLAPTINFKTIKLPILRHFLL